MNSFKKAAYQVLLKSGPLHYKEITKKAIQQKLIKSSGITPWATMNAILSVDIKQKGSRSQFIRTKPGCFYLNTYYKGFKERQGDKEYQAKITEKEIVDSGLNISIELHQVNTSINSKQKGDIAEARVAELITLYGNEGLYCYKPISDVEGIDLIVKRRARLEVVYLQVKSTYGDGKTRGFTSTVKGKTIKDKSRMLLIFVYFDLSNGDLFDQIFCIPAPDFLKLTQNTKKTSDDRIFTVGIKNPDKSKYAEFMIEKRELATKIVEIMDKLQ